MLCGTSHGGITNSKLFLNFKSAEAKWTAIMLIIQQNIWTLPSISCLFGFVVLCRSFVSWQFTHQIAGLCIKTGYSLILKNVAHHNLTKPATSFHSDSFTFITKLNLAFGCFSTLLDTETFNSTFQLQIDTRFSNFRNFTR